MSAYIVEPCQIAAIVGSMAHYDGSWQRGNVSEASMALTAAMLMRENVRSVNYRYGEGTEPEDVSGSDCEFFRIKPLPPGVLAKLIANLEYQSCERPDWQQSEAYRYLQDARDWLLCKLPGYESAPWGVDKAGLKALGFDLDGPRAISLMQLIDRKRGISHA